MVAGSNRYCTALSALPKAAVRAIRTWSRGKPMSQRAATTASSAPAPPTAGWGAGSGAGWGGGDGAGAGTGTCSSMGGGTWDATAAATAAATAGGFGFMSTMKSVSLMEREASTV
eukprot:scaffold16613_cov101-Isochrysis_galbana.AAC.1